MLKELAVFMLGASALGIAVLLFSLELPVVDISVLPALESLKYTVSLFTAAAVLVLFIYAEL